MTSYKKQHIIPKTYLKHFSVEKSVFLAQLKHKYNKNIQNKGIGDKIFCRDNYYDFPNTQQEPILEKMFSKHEGDYDKGLKMLNDKLQLGYVTKQLFINWMLMMKTRNTFFRDTITEMATWIERTSFGLVHGRAKMLENEGQFTRTGKTVGKGTQLSYFLTQDQYSELQKQYSINFLNRIWTVLYSGDRNFLTSDNPGFSFTFSQHLLRLRMSPISPIYNLQNDVHSAHTFPLTRKLCLALTPIIWDDNVEEEKVRRAFHDNIKFENAPCDLVDSINIMTIATAHDLIIGSEKDDLERYRAEITARQKNFE